MKKSYWVVVNEHGFIGLRHFDSELEATMVAALYSELDEKKWKAKEILCG